MERIHLTCEVQEVMTAFKNRMIRWLDRYFPDFSQIFPRSEKICTCRTRENTVTSQSKTAEERGLNRNCRHLFSI